MNDEVTILVVEDSLTQAEQLKYILEKNDYKVIVANDGLEALEYINKFRPDLVITDILMPKMDGYELCQKIKENDELKSIPVILLTSLSDPIDVITGLRVRADNFITKPYNERFLLSRIKHMLINLELRKNRVSEIGIEVFFEGERHFINSERIQIIDLLLSTFENAVQKTKELEETNKELKKAVETIKKLENNYRTILESNTDALIVVNNEKQILYLNPAAKKLFGENYEEMICGILDFNEMENSTKEVIIDGNDMRQIIAEMCISETNWEGEDAYILSVRDVTDKVRLREKLKIQSFTDELTSLYNRRGFFSLAERKIQFATRNKKSMALFFIDIDDMKSINDKLSHNKGDCALVAASKILKEAFNENDVIGRIGGDEFAVLSVNVDEYDINNLLNRISIKQEEFNEKDRYEFDVSLSVGTAYFDPENPLNIDELMAKADKLMYEHKKSKRGEENI